MCIRDSLKSGRFVLFLKVQAGLAFPGGFVKGVVQGFLVKLLGTDHAPGVLIKIRLYHSGFGVLLSLIHI